ncbi:hypothetical protein AUP68_15154 [Ilyonectria robusta]
MLDYQFKQSHYDSIVLSGLAIMGIDGKGKWIELAEYTPKYSGVIKVARMLVLYQSYVEREDEVTEKMKVMDEEQAREEAEGMYRIVRRKSHRFMTRVSDATLAERLQKSGNIIKTLWVPSGDNDFSMSCEAKAEARRAVQGKHRPEKPAYQAHSTQIRLAIAQQQRQKTLPDRVGNFSKRIDKALPGIHIHSLYRLKRRESDMLAHLRTGMARTNGYLYRIGAVESDMG